MTAPVIFQWDGDAMKPLARFEKLCAKQYVVGLEYPMVVQEQRSRASHNQYFAAIQDAWDNLPEIHAGRWPTPEHLRKWALVQAGYRVEKTIVAKTKADALRISAFVQSLDEWAVVLVNGNIVAHYTAKSQSLSAMDRKEFQASKQAVLDVLDKLLGLEPGSLTRQSPPLAPAHHRERETEPAE
jgi:hypothetical protein